MNSVCLLVCALSGSLEYSSVVSKLIYIIWTDYIMFRIENGVYADDGSCKETRKKIPIHYCQWAKTVKSAICHVYNILNTLKLT